MKHYVYVTKGKCGRHYIGVRSCKGDPAEDPYMGSHRDPEYSPVEKWIWSEFDTREEAANAEASLHEVFDVATSLHFANRCKALPNGFSVLGTSWGTHSEKTKALLSQQKKGENNHRWGKPSSQKQKEAVRQARAGVKASEETCQKMSKAQKGLKKPPGYAERMSALKKECRWFYDPIEDKAHLVHPEKAEPHWIKGFKNKPPWLG
jgi:hypothetical protein